MKAQSKTGASPRAEILAPAVEAPANAYSLLFDPQIRGYSIPEAAQVMRVSPLTVKRLIRTGKLPSIKIGKRRIVTPHVRGAA
jgi:excisionase family DNA binding protein